MGARRIGADLIRLAARQRIHPAHFAEEADDLTQRQENAEGENKQDQPVETGIGHEGIDICFCRMKAMKPARMRKISIRTRKMRGDETL